MKIAIMTQSLGKTTPLPWQLFLQNSKNWKGSCYCWSCLLCDWHKLQIYTWNKKLHLCRDYMWRSEEPIIHWVPCLQGRHTGRCFCVSRVQNSNSIAYNYAFRCTDTAGNDEKPIKMQAVGNMWGTGLFKANSCDFCDDVTTELADISLGDAWLEPFQ